MNLRKEIKIERKTCTSLWGVHSPIWYILFLILLRRLFYYDHRPSSCHVLCFLTSVGDDIIRMMSSTYLGNSVLLATLFACPRAHRKITCFLWDVSTIQSTWTGSIFQRIPTWTGSHIKIASFPLDVVWNGSVRVVIIF